MTDAVEDNEGISVGTETQSRNFLNRDSLLQCQRTGVEDHQGKSGHGQQVWRHLK